MLSLGYLGLLPFIGGLILVLTESTLLDISGKQYFTTYSAIILSFLSGVLWGQAISSFDLGYARITLIFSNVFALLAWVSLLTDNNLAVLLLLCGYVLVWLTEKRLREQTGTVTPEGYQTLRNRLTIGVILMHLVLLLLLFVS